MGRVIEFNEARKRIIKKKKRNYKRLNTDYKVLLMICIGILLIIMISLLFKNGNINDKEIMLHKMIGMGMF